MALDSFLAPLRPLAKLSWSRLENLHITTQFIGEWPEARLDELKRGLTNIPPSGAIEIAVRGLGWFPNERRPRTFWAGVDGGEPLRALARVTGEVLVKLGVALEDRVYSPHLTLARIRESVSLDALRKAMPSAGQTVAFGSFRAAAFHLYLSAGGRYTQLASFPLE